MNAFLYLAQGAGSHPVVVFLHGYPENERNIDLAQAVRRAGYDALFLDYRGSWGSGGTFSFQHALEDGVSALAWVAQALTAAGGRRVTSVTYDDDHPFSAHRLALADTRVRWLDTDCTSAQLSPPRAPIHQQEPQSQYDANHRRD